MDKPDLSAIENCLGRLAHAMNMTPPSKDMCKNLIDHVLFQTELDGVPGRGAFDSLKLDLITERECRNLLLAHFERKMVAITGYESRSLESYLTKELVSELDVALLGRGSNRTSIDSIDPWEQTPDV